MAVGFNLKQDTRILIPWHKPISTRYNTCFYIKAYEALKNKPYLLDEMKSRIRASKSPRQTLKIMQDYVKFE